MDLDEREDLREFLSELYGQQNVSKWQMNEAVFNLTFELIEKSKSCTGAMKYVPQPRMIGQTPYKWMAAQVRKAFLRELKNNKKHYVICLKAAALAMVREFQEAGSGY